MVLPFYALAVFTPNVTGFSVIRSLVRSNPVVLFRQKLPQQQSPRSGFRARLSSLSAPARGQLVRFSRASLLAAVLFQRILFPLQREMAPILPLCFPRVDRCRERSHNSSFHRTLLFLAFQKTDHRQYKNAKTSRERRRRGDFDDCNRVGLAVFQWVDTADIFPVQF